MNAGQVAFYTTVATVIPVLVLGYLFAAATVIRRITDWINAQFEAYLDAENDPDKKATPSSMRQQRSEAAQDWLRQFQQYRFRGWSWPIRVLLVGVLFCVIVGPGIAEVVSLAALARYHATHASLVWAWVGLALSGAALAIPVIVAIVSVLFGSDWLVQGTKVYAAAMRGRQIRMEKKAREDTRQMLSR